VTPAATGEVYEVVLECRQEGQQVMNVLHFRALTPSDNVELRLLRALVECLLTVLLPGSTSNLQFVKCRGKRVFPDLGPVLEVGPELGDVVQGADVGDSVPTFVSVCANIHTTRGGKVGRGRMFIFGVPEGATQGSYIQGDPPAANRWQIGVQSRKLGGAKAPYTVEGFAPAVSIIPNNRLASTVSRKVGHGR
jgi:hypothetical protein